MARPTTLSAYLESLDVDQRATIDRLMDRARARLPGFHEQFEFGMPYYRRGTTASVGFAARGKGVAIYPGEAVLSKLQTRLHGVDHGNGCVRFARREKIDWDLVDELLRTVDQLPS